MPGCVAAYFVAGHILSPATVHADVHSTIVGNRQRKNKNKKISVDDDDDDVNIVMIIIILIFKKIRLDFC